MSFLTLASADIDRAATSVSVQLLDSVIVFGNTHFYLTGGDVFIHNHLGIDDCAYGIDPNDLSMKSFAVITKNSYLNSANFYELSVHWGFYEILATGGYYSVGASESQPFLSSSIPGWEFGETKSSIIYVTERQDFWELIRTERLLNQYMKRDAHRPWGFHCVQHYIKGFTPILPLHFIDHESQKLRQVNVHHLASKLLHIVTSPTKVNKDEIVKKNYFLLEVKNLLVLW